MMTLDARFPEANYSDKMYMLRLALADNFATDLVSSGVGMLQTYGPKLWDFVKTVGSHYGKQALG